MNQQQLMLMEANSSFVEQREKEIQNVVRSIFELNTIFKVFSLVSTCNSLNYFSNFLNYTFIGNIPYGS